MNEFESDLVPLSNVRVIPYGAPDQLDVWFDEQDREDEDPFFDPDNPFGEDLVDEAVVDAVIAQLEDMVDSPDFWLPPF